MMRFADGMVAAEVSGAGPTVWVLHSLLADAGSCTPLADALSGRFRVVVPDLPGFGGSAVAAGLEAAAARVAAAIAEDAAVHGPVAVIGNGYGSFVAVLVALRRPGVVGRLVLAGTGAAFSEPGRAAFQGMAAAAKAKGLAAIADVAMRRLFAPDFQAANPALTAERRERFLATDPAVFAQACADLAAIDLRAQVTALRLPVLVVAGDGDEATPPAMARELAGLVPGAVFLALTGLAHVPQLQDTAGFVATIEPFLAA